MTNKKGWIMGDVFEGHVRYHKALEKMSKLLEKTFNNEVSKRDTGFVLLVLRDRSPGNVDMVSNLTETSAVFAIEGILEAVKNRDKSE